MPLKCTSTEVTWHGACHHYSPCRLLFEGKTTRALLEVKSTCALLALLKPMPKTPSLCYTQQQSF